MLCDGQYTYLVGHDTATPGGVVGWEGSHTPMGPVVWTYVLPDALGSVRQETDATGTVTAAREWSPYGVEVGSTQGGLGYTGEWFDTSVGMTYLRARWYDGGTGRFTQVDLWEGRLQQPATLNRYAYVLNNPVRYTDPSGHASCADMPWECGSTEWHYLSDKREASLAVYQQDQGASNDCAIYSTAAAHDALLGGRMNASTLSNWVDSTWWRVPGRYRTLPGEGTTPREQARLFNALAASQGVPASASAGKGTTGELKALLDQPDTAVLVTIGWNKSTGLAPTLMRGDGNDTNPLTPSNNFWGKAGVNAHTMVLAAYDSEHRMPNGTLAPWGFINSWNDGRTMNPPVLWWMTDRDFNRVWNYSIPGIGSNNRVIVTQPE